MSRSDRHRNRRRILLAQSLRAFAYGYTAILIGKALAKSHSSGLVVGITLSAIILGGVLTSLLMIPLSKRFSRRELYCAFYLFISLSGIALYFYPKIWALTIVGLLGVLSTDASDNGPATTIEQTMLTERISDEKITGYLAGTTAMPHSLLGSVRSSKVRLIVDISLHQNFKGSYSWCLLV